MVDKAERVGYVTDQWRIQGQPGGPLLCLRLTCGHPGAGKIINVKTFFSYVFLVTFLLFFFCNFLFQKTLL